MIYPYAPYQYKDEAQCVAELLAGLHWPDDFLREVEEAAIGLVTKTRNEKGRGGQLEAFLQEFSLNTDEGLAMMCLAEALLRIPDARTANELIRDKVAAANWLERQGGESKDWMTKAAGIGMALTRKTLESSLARLGEPVIREAMIRAMQMMGRQFVLGTDMQGAMNNAKPLETQGYRMSYDILGEGARDAATAERYYKSYAAAIENLGIAQGKYTKGRKAGVSVKLSALHPRYTYSQKDVCIPAMAEKLKALAKKAAEYNIPLTVDAEEASRLDLSVAIITKVLETSGLNGWDGFGMAVQAYQKRAVPLIDYMVEVAKANGRKMQIRLVKGAYWDSEIKRAQMEGFDSYPIFTRKCHTDVSYLACAAKLFSHKDILYPMLATHNAHSVAAVAAMAKKADADFEFQRLHGMGEGLYACVLRENIGKVSVYAPVGSHKDLLPYLVRRLLENGANSSFVNKLLDKKIAEKDIVRDPVVESGKTDGKPHPRIPLPQDIFAPARKNSRGLDLNDPYSSAKTVEYVRHYKITTSPCSIVEGKKFDSVSDKFIDRCFAKAKSAFPAWDAKGVRERTDIVWRFAELLEQNRDELMAILVHEGGKTIPDALAEIREAVDFCHYYAMRAESDFQREGTLMRGYTGEENRLTLHGRGVFVCISPWNFPLAIFVGQILAALLAGNAVLAKPASQTKLIAMRAIELMQKAGVPVDILYLLLGDGAFAGQMVSHPDVAGVVFTGSTATAKSIQKRLADKDGAIVPLIAETGGQNAMIVDSSALPEQVVDDVILSAFGSAGQRCSALRVLYVQNDIADQIIHLLKGAMREISVAEPKNLSADIGRIIDASALKNLENHVTYLDRVGVRVAVAQMQADLSYGGHYFEPVAYELSNIGLLAGEVFGPVLHIIRFDALQIQDVIAQINNTGFGLTFGLHSRIEGKQDWVAAQVRAGNIYINRSMIGAVVGVQPFGGMGLSGTGPKAGGPHYLRAFAVEKLVSVNTVASGGNASLVTMDE